jgi:hypothetical protein
MANPEFEGIRARVIQQRQGKLAAARRSHNVRTRGWPSARVATKTVVRTKFERVRSKAGKVKSGAVQGAKNSAAYYAQRVDLEGNRQQRPAFDAEREQLSRAEVNTWIEAQSQERNYLYRMVLSPGEKMDVDEIKDWTRAVLERHGIENYVAFAHAGEKAHTDHDHVHILIYQDDKFERPDFQALRVLGDEQAERQMSFQKELQKFLEAELKHEMGSGTRDLDELEGIKRKSSGKDLEQDSGGSGGNSGNDRKRSQQMEFGG